MLLFINVLTIFVELAVLLAGRMEIKRDAVPQELHPGDSGWGCGLGRKHSPSPVVCDLEGVAYPGVDPVVG